VVLLSALYTLAGELNLYTPWTNCFVGFNYYADVVESALSSYKRAPTMLGLELFATFKLLAESVTSSI